MRNVLLSTVALMALTGSALAADLPSRKAALRSMSRRFRRSPGPASTSVSKAARASCRPMLAGFATNNQTAGLIGGVVGYNYEFPNRFVLGLEGDAGGVIGAKKTYANPVFTTDSSYFADIRGRIGYAIADRALLFAAGGVAFGDTTFNSVSAGPRRLDRRRRRRLRLHQQPDRPRRIPLHRSRPSDGQQRQRPPGLQRCARRPALQVRRSGLCSGRRQVLSFFTLNWSRRLNPARLRNALRIWGTARMRFFLRSFENRFPLFRLML